MATDSPQLQPELPPSGSPSAGLPALRVEDSGQPSERRPQGPREVRFPTGNPPRLSYDPARVRVRRLDLVLGAHASWDGANDDVGALARAVEAVLVLRMRHDAGPRALLRRRAPRAASNSEGL